MPSVPSAISMVSAYRFVDLGDAPALRDRLAASAQQAALKGTVIVAPEGINLMLAGRPQAVRQWLAALQEDARFAGLPIHTHNAEQLPFRRLRVKLKREIIRLDKPEVRPAQRRAPAVDAATLVRWLDAGRCDQGRPVALLDTRNGFEVDAGAFEGAIDWRLSKFSDFATALDTHRSQLEGKTVVSYCTGGIRCEKAALWLAHAGVAHAMQLDGGILRYFEHTGDAPHWRGACVVFDDRGSVAAGAAQPA